MYDQRKMYLADQEALANVNSKVGGPFGAVIVKDHKIIAHSHNQVLSTNDPTMHAEIATIRKACKKLNTYDLTGCVLYTNAMPCPMCLSAIIWANIKTVYYGNTAKDTAKIGFRDDAIYQYLAGKNKMLKLEQHNHRMTIETFKKFQKSNKIIY